MRARTRGRATGVLPLEFDVELAVGTETRVLREDPDGLGWWTADGDQATVADTISWYAEGLLAGWIEKSREQDEGREVVAYEGAEDPRLLLRDPSSFTLDEAREQAATEVLDASLRAAAAQDAGAREFYAEIEEAAIAFPQVVTRLLYEARRQSS